MVSLAAMETMTAAALSGFCLFFAFAAMVMEIAVSK